MQETTKGVSLVQAVEDLKTRSLAFFSTEMAKLVYLSSTRDRALLSRRLGVPIPKWTCRSCGWILP